jgi:hypothetical protein
MLWACPAQGQERSPSVVATVVSADTIAIGDLFEVELTLEVPSGWVVAFPDSLTGPGFEPFETVQWLDTTSPDGPVALTVRYPLIAFQVGRIEVPEIPVYAVPALEAQARGFTAPGESVAPWAPIGDAPEHPPGTTLFFTTPQEVWAASVLMLVDVSDGIRPRPPADVVGADVHWLAVVLVTLFGGGLLAIGSSVAADRVHAHLSRVAADLEPRARALAALDALLESGQHRTGRVRAFYHESSGIVRRYVESWDLRWSPSWTSTELMRDLDRRWQKIAGGLKPEMRDAESVKFGGAERSPEEAEAHWSAVRSWIEATPERDENAS